MGFSDREGGREARKGAYLGVFFHVCLKSMGRTQFMLRYIVCEVRTATREDFKVWECTVIECS